MTKIKKYQNRKLYDQEAASYVSVLDLARRVAAGEEVEVSDDRTGADVTLSVLVRALYDLVREGERFGRRPTSAGAAISKVEEAVVLVASFLPPAPRVSVPEVDRG